MARIRTIKPEFWADEELSALPEATHMLAGALLNYADDFGYFNANVALVKASCSPIREPSVSIPESLRSLQEVGFIKVGTAPDGKRYGHVVKFSEHQRVSHPTESKIKCISIAWDDFQNPPENFGNPPESFRPEQGTGNREQGRGTGNKDSSLRSDSATAAPPPLDLTPSNQPEAGALTRRAERLAAITEDAIGAYNEILGKPNGKLTAVSIRVGRKTRRAEVNRVLECASEICLEKFGDKRITPAFWSAYFTTCDEDPWLRGDGPYSGAHANWKPDFEYLTKPKTMLKVFERAVSEAAE